MKRIFTCLAATLLVGAMMLAGCEKPATPDDPEEPVEETKTEDSSEAKTPDVIQLGAPIPAAVAPVEPEEKSSETVI